MRHAWIASTLLVILAFVAGCHSREKSEPGNGVVVLTAWAHHGKPEEWAAMQKIVRDFNASTKEERIHLVEIAEANYDTQVQSAAASGALPDILEFDGPLLANYAWKGYLSPIDDLLDPKIRADLIPSIVRQGTWNGHLYAVGMFDSGLGIWVDRAQLHAIGARVPKGWKDAWTIDELDAILAKLSAREKRLGEDGRVIDLKRDYRGEWWTWGFYPALVSGGADLIDRDGDQTADGVLNGPAAVAVLGHFQKWFEDGLVDPNTDGRAFIDRRVALSWVGHWEYPRYHEALGADLALVPLPDFGHGARTAMGSWCWSITRSCKRPRAAIRFIDYLLGRERILEMTRANGAVPATNEAIAASPLYGAHGELRLFAEQLRSIAVPRPRTPAYPVITSAFQEAMLDIIDGAPVRKSLDRAVRIIDDDIRENRGYPVRK